MNLAAHIDDYKVSVGPRGYCHNVALTETNLSCILPQIQEDDGQILVVVSVFKLISNYVRAHRDMCLGHLLIIIRFLERVNSALGEYRKSNFEVDFSKISVTSSGVSIKV